MTDTVDFWCSREKIIEELQILPENEGKTIVIGVESEFDVLILVKSM